MNTLFVITGPTASGKTSVSVQLAERLGCDIISADSRQFYRGMPIGTAAPAEDDLRRVIHHFAGFLSPDSYYSASIFEQDVIRLLPSLFSKNEIVIMAGGSGLYINAVCNGIDEIPDVEAEVRERYINRLREEGIEPLRRELRMVDPEHYKKVDLKNPRRIMRALEIFASTGRPYSSFLTRSKQPREFRILKTGIMPERSLLYSRIDERVDLMIETGLEREARSLYHLRHLNALQTVGYREFFDYFDGKISFERAVELIKRNTRRYARRQISWWSQDDSVKWFDSPDCDEFHRYILQQPGMPSQG